MEYDEIPVSDSAKDVYKRHIKTIKAMYSSKKLDYHRFAVINVRNIRLSTIAWYILLYNTDRKWIIDDHPHITQILEEFPCLMQPTLVNTNYVNHVCIFCSLHT